MLFATLRAKLMLILLAAIAGVAFVAASSLFNERQSLLNDRKVKTQHLVESAVGVVAYFHGRQQSGALSEADAKQEALAALATLRYAKSEYFWVNDMHPTVLMHPVKPELNGKDVSSVTDPNGKPLFMEFVRTVQRDKAGFVEYLWPKPGFDKPVPKLSYVQEFEPWHWIIGSGIYVDDVQAIFEDRLRSLAAITAGIALTLIVIIVLLSRAITRPIGQITAVMEHIRQTGNLSERIPSPTHRSELTVIGEAFNGMLEQFVATIQKVLISTEHLQRTVASLVQSSLELANSSHAQSEAAASAAAAVEESKASMDQVASNANSANSMAMDSGSMSIVGEETVKSAAAEMQLIATSVGESAKTLSDLGSQIDRISSITHTIKEIADQTNLLALNAAIEAARAGDAGRGFAVVADEVRKLAERTAQSTEEIASMVDIVQAGTRTAIKSMQEGSSRVEGGARLANEACESMSVIRDSQNRVVSAIADIDAAVREQAAAVGLVAEKIVHIAEMTDRNHSETGRITQATSDIEILARELADEVACFRIDPGAVAAARRSSDEASGAGMPRVELF